MQKFLHKKLAKFLPKIVQNFCTKAIFFIRDLVIPDIKPRPRPRSRPRPHCPPFPVRRLARLRAMSFQFMGPITPVAKPANKHDHNNCHHYYTTYYAPANKQNNQPVIIYQLTNQLSLETKHGRSEILN